MHVSDIPKILDLAVKVRKNGKNIVPCIVGAAGLGKSQCVHQWAIKNGYHMIDMRLAMKDSSDFFGLPFYDAENKETVFAKPEDLPKAGKVLMFLDEINRGNTAVQNAVLQLLTDRKIGTKYTLPEECIIVTAINPENSEHYDVNSMDGAMKNRLQMYEVKYSPKALIEYARKKEWSSTVVSFIASGNWTYKEPGAGDEFYIAPRNWERISDAEIAGVKDDPDLHHEVCVAELGKNIGLAYWNFVHKQKPVTLDDLLSDYESVGKKADKITTMESFKRLEEHSSTKKSGTYRADLISVTMQSFVQKHDKVDIDILVKVVEVLPTDQATGLIQQVSLKKPDPAAWISQVKSKHPTVFERLKRSIVKDGVKSE